ANLARRDQIEAELEARLGRDVQREPSRVRVGVAVRDERERRAAQPLHLERWLEAGVPPGHEACRRGDEGAVPGAAAVLAPPERVHAAHELGVEADARVEPEAP